jgi:hypothetical protein
MLKLTHKKQLLLLILMMVFGQSIAQYEIKKYSINSGGDKLNQGQYELNSSIGQTDANGTLVGGNYSLNAGFRQENTDLIYKNGLE